MASSLTVTQRTPFCFLRIPGEVRDRIYYYALGNAILMTNGPSSRVYMPREHPPKSEWPFIGLLLTSKQIYHEASYTLYKHGRFHIPLRLIFLSLELFDLTFLAETRLKLHLDLIQNLHVDMGWLEGDEFHLYRSSMGSTFPSKGVEAVCETIGILGHLKTLSIKWIYVHRWPWIENVPRPGVDLLRQLLQPFVKLQAKRPELKIMIEINRNVLNLSSVTI